MKSQNKRILDWNLERNLIKTPNIKKEISFIIEECIEMVSNLNSEEARPAAEEIAEMIMALGDGKMNPERVVDAACDIKVFASGLINKIGYDGDLAMNEVLQEIESRTGSLQDGKYTKDKSAEAQAKWYKADFSKALI
jgi:hypothetical protein